jgi:hypothetical protein
MKTPALPSALALAACLLASTAATAPAAVAGRTPAHYKVVEKVFTATDGTQSRGIVSCPAGSVVFSGGALLFSSTALQINSSSPLPDGSGWVIDANNTSGADQFVTVQAVCARAPRRYRILRSNEVTVPANSQAGGQMSCPDNTVVFGGGVLSDSDSVADNVNSSFPFNGINGWIARENNNVSAPTTFTVFAICGKAPIPYEIFSGPMTVNPPSFATLTSAVCPFGQPLSGGGFSSSISPFVSLNSTFASTQAGPGGPQPDWAVDEIDADFVPDITIQAFVVCA